MATEYTVPLPGETEHFTMTGPWPLTSDQWSYLMDVMCAMHDGLVSDPVVVETRQEVNTNYDATEKT
jgi:hypothetical protein